MIGILKRSSINLFYVLVTLFFVLVILSIIYYYLFYIALQINLPLPNGESYPITLTNYDIIMISINGIITDIKNKYVVQNPEKIDKYVNEINEVINDHKEYYLFYYDLFNKLYPKRYFIFCTDSSCNMYFFGAAGITKTNESVEKPLIVWIDENLLKTLIIEMKKNNSNVINIFKDGLKRGKIKLKNFEVILEKIFKEYS